MHTTDSARIARLTDRGVWGNETLHGLLAQWAGTTPDALAVADQPNKPALTGSPAVRLSYRELDQASDHLAQQLRRRGVTADSRIMVQLPNIVELVVCFFATSKLGAVISPLPMQYGAHEIASLAAVLSPDLFISLESFKDNDPATIVRGALPTTEVCCIGPDVDCLSSTLCDDSDVMATAKDPHRILTVCWTSGTTGTPKGVPRSHAMWIATARATMEAGGYLPSERLLNPFPLVNMAALGGFVFPAALTGGALFLHHPLDPQLFLTQLQDEAINFTVAPPMLLNQLASQNALWGAFDFSALRAVGSGSAPLSEGMIRTFEDDYGKPIINFYGSNEGIALFATPANAREPRVRAQCFPRLGQCSLEQNSYAGRAVATKIIDTDTGAEILAPSQPGELCIDGATVFDGYLGTDNSEVFTQDGYFRTGDLVEIYAEAPDYYRIVGRCKDIINRAGMKISPSEIDALLEGHPALKEAAVCGVADADYGERVCACIVSNGTEGAPSLESINDYLRQRGLAVFKLPEQLLILEALPRNPMGKVMRSALSEQALNGKVANS